MKLENNFTIDAPVEKAWEALNTPETVAPCFPGATLTSYEDDSFTGTVKIKLGPIAMTYKGKGTYVTRDEAAHEVVIDATGRDSRGNGTATAKVTASLAADGPDRTAVSMVTDMTITGKPAQFGRGVISDVADKIIGQFSACVARKLAPEAEAAEAAPVSAAAAPASEAMADGPSSTPAVAAAPAGAKAVSDRSAATHGAATNGAATNGAATNGAAATPTEPAVSEATADAVETGADALGTSESGTLASGTPGSGTSASNIPASGTPGSATPEPGTSASRKSSGTSAAGTSAVDAPASTTMAAPVVSAAATSAAPRRATPMAPVRSEVDAIDLLDTAGAPVLKRLAPVAAGALFLVLVILLVRRLRGA